MYSKTAWNDYFPAVKPITTLNSQTFNSRQTPSGSYVHISNCLFSSISTTATGGAVYCSSMTYFLVESTSFISCETSSSSYGGAIYFACSNAQSVLHGVCGYDCCATCSSGSNYQFAYIYVNNAASSKNYFNYSSITRCVNENTNSWWILNLYNGNLCCPSVNISLNKCYYDLIYCYPSIISNSVTCSFSYSSFADNIAGYYTLFYLRTGANYEMKSCNILRNTQGTLGSQGTIATWGNMEIQDSCILENKATYIFYQGNTNYRTTISNCTVDSTSNNGYMTTKNTVTKSFLHALNHMSTQNCHSGYDSAGTLTPIVQTPSSSKKRLHLCTCSQSPLRIFFLLTCVSLVLKILPQ
jgi:hypothetical protein